MVADRFAALMARHPGYATFLGLHEHDHELADGSREAILAEMDAARRFLTALEAIDPRQLSRYYATERELALFATRRQLFDDEVHRVWERRVSASDEIGDGIFLLYLDVSVSRLFPAKRVGAPIGLNNLVKMSGMMCGSLLAGLTSRYDIPFLAAGIVVILLSPFVYRFFRTI